MDALYMDPKVVKKGVGQGISPSSDGSTVELNGSVMVGGVEKTAKITFQVDNRDVVDFFDQDKTYTVAFTENV